MKKNSTDFARLLSSFLTDYLPLQRNYSKNTVLSYRDTFKILLKYIQDIKRIKLSSFYLKDFNRTLIIEFLEWYRNSGASVTSTNQRLAAIKSYCEYAQLESIENLQILMDIGGIKSKKSSSREISYLTVEQTKKLINMPDIHNLTGFRHRLVLTALYDTGCRVQELCDIRIKDVFLSGTSTICLHGKGNKTRTIVISDGTAKLIEQYLGKYRKGSLSDEYLITNRNHQKIDRDGVSYIVKKYSDKLHLQDNSFPEHVHCHMFRHSKAMHMLEAGINIVYIRDFLGHEDISTTMIYAKADNRLKEEAICKLSPKITETSNLPDWRKDQDLMDFLNSLK